MGNKIIIAGSRGFTDYDLLQRTLNTYGISPHDKIISGTANGADKLGEKYANENSIEVKRFPAEWDKYGKSAGYKRNEQMALYADSLIAFWDGKSKGTKHMIDLAKRHNLKVEVVAF